MKGIVKRIIDGDTLEVLIRVRMARIDAPETKGKEKAMGDVTKAYVTGKLLEKEIELAVEGSDVYDRTLAEIYLDGKNFNDELVANKKAEIYSPANHNNGKLDI